MLILKIFFLEYIYLLKGTPKNRGFRLFFNIKPNSPTGNTCKSKNVFIIL